ncbi:hypothetical protein OIU77_002102 [Salix suchowensis]|uniref:PPM-type phosphatase domain-containing protein n=1 Tax=Salix suchowensis TaxID=1278906 RepID=A0ABQ9B6M8_9ROSI|nr:hypothetical protein OIU77_002102 [Salix suchowensis]
MAIIRWREKQITPWKITWSLISSKWVRKELGLFAVYDGHLGHDVASYLQTHLFDNILKEHDFWTDTESAIRRAYLATDAEILEKGDCP